MNKNINSYHNSGQLCNYQIHTDSKLNQKDSIIEVVVEKIIIIDL
jgi:hypothetical protein